ncbi:MAG: NeuD/PglB/VioB family sugar acetyltransferase [Cellulophaga sp.]|nr:NeuD/PglB/VioB family sugar acetyltransferase [Cellulophaga sp.]
MDKKNAVILGGGTYGEVFLTYLLEQGFNIVGFFDDNKVREGEILHGVPVLGTFEDLLLNNDPKKINQVFCPIGDNKIRTKYLTILRNKGFEIPNFIHESVILSKDIIIGQGVYLLPGVIIMPHTTIKDFVIVSMGSRVAHHTILDEGTFISTGVNVGASIHIAKKAFLGISATIMTGVKNIGENAIVGSGAVVIRDVKANHIVAGVPAKTLRVIKKKKDSPPLNDTHKINVKEMEIVGYSLTCLNLKTLEDIEQYKKYLLNFKGYDAFYKTELFDAKSTETDQLKYFILKKEEEVLVLMPFSMRKIIIHSKDTSYSDVSAFYGYSGPLFNPKIIDTDLKCFWHLADTWYQKNKVISEFMRFNLGGNYHQYSGILKPTLNNVIGEILKDEHTQWLAFPSKVRNNYRKAMNHGLVAKIYHQEITEKIIGIFYDIYIRTMERNKAENNYFFSLNYFKDLILNNPENTLLILICKDDVPISTELILLNKHTMYSFLGGTVAEFFNLRPNDFLKMEAMKWGRTNGFIKYILGGGRANEDSLYKYKKSFFPNTEDVVYYTGRKIINEVVYEKLVTMNLKYQYTINAIDIKNQYFPLYRKEIL